MKRGVSIVCSQNVYITVDCVMQHAQCVATSQSGTTDGQVGKPAAKQEGETRPTSNLHSDSHVISVSTPHQAGRRWTARHLINLASFAFTCCPGLPSCLRLVQTLLQLQLRAMLRLQLGAQLSGLLVVAGGLALQLLLVLRPHLAQPPLQLRFVRGPHLVPQLLHLIRVLGGGFGGHLIVHSALGDGLRERLAQVLTLFRQLRLSLLRP